MSEIRRIPRWLYLEDVLPVDSARIDEGGASLFELGVVKTPSPSFRNDTGYPFKLESLTVGQMLGVLQNPGLDVPVPEDVLHYFWWGGFGAFHEIEIGISGQDVNMVPSMVGVACADRYPQMLCSQVFQVGAPIKFEIPYILAKDNGLHFTFYSLRDRIRLSGAETPDYPSLARNGAVMAYGRDVVTNRPVIFTGNTEYLPTTNAGHDRYTCSSADLMNRGQNDVAIEEIVFTINLAGAPAEEVDATFVQSFNYIRSGFFDAYHVNPILGQPWMPGSLPIPIAMLAGRTFRGASPRDLGPHVYTFPADIYLQRREELNVRIQRSKWSLLNRYTYIEGEEREEESYVLPNQPISACLFGYLEVQ